MKFFYKVFFTFTLFLLSLAAWSYTPTIESIFRNGANPDLDGETVLAEFTIEKESNVNESPVLEGDAEDRGLLVEPFRPHYYKILFSNEQSQPRMVQVRYEGTSATDDLMRSVDYFPSLSPAAMRFSDEDLEKKMFYSLLTSMVNNQSNAIISLFHELGINDVINRDKINEQQKYYLKNYINYLKNNVEDDAQERENPLRPSDPEMAQKVGETMKQPYLKQSKYMKRIKVGEKFFWKFETEGLMAKFTHEDHRLVSMSLSSNLGSLTVECENYILFGKGMEFPELVYLTDLSGQRYKLKMHKLTYFTDRGNNFQNRIGRYRDKLSTDQNYIFNSIFTL